MTGDPSRRRGILALTGGLLPAARIMVLPHGRDISAEQLELIVGRKFSVERFASLCNAVSWALGDQARLPQVSFTERVSVKDNGIDGEWSIDVPQEASETGLLRRGRNVLQYKKRDITASDRAAVIAKLRRELRGAGGEVERRTGMAVDRYTLFTNVDVAHEQKRDLKEAIGDGSQHEMDVLLIGGAELASLLNSLPHLRSAFFATSQFATWSARAEGFAKQVYPPGDVEFVGRAVELAAAKNAIDNPDVRVLSISGPPSIGKTRLTLRATEHRPLQTVFVLDPVSLKVTELLALATPKTETLVVVEDPDRASVENLIEAVLSSPELKLIVTLPTTETTQKVNFARDPRIKSLRLRGLEEKESQELLQAAGAIDYSIASWVIDQAGGNPGVLLTAASIGSKLRIEGPSFLEQIGLAFEAKAQELMGVDAIASLRLLAVMTPVGCSGQPAHELQVICQHFGGPIDLNRVLNLIPRFENAGFVRRSGSYVEVVPPLFANYSASCALRGRPSELVSLLAVLPDKRRLFRRMALLSKDATADFWNDLFGNEGPCRDLTTALQHSELLRLIAPAVPEQLGKLILQGLEAMSHDERLRIDGGDRRNLMWALEELLFRRRTSEAALRSVGLLAEAETERLGNNASEIFKECFHPLHPQFPLPLPARLQVLREQLRPERTIETRLLAVQAISEAFVRHGVVMLRRTMGPDPLDARPELTCGEVWTYWSALLEQLITLMDGEDQEVAAKAASILPDAIAEYILQSPPDHGIRLLEDLVPRVLRGTARVRIADLAAALHLARQGLHEGDPRYEENGERLGRLISSIDESSYAIRIKRWVGSWEFGERVTDERGEAIFHGKLMARRLAQEAVRNENSLTADLFEWLISEEAKRAPEFFYWLGVYDTPRRWLVEIQRIGESQFGEKAFASYMGGLSKVDSEFVGRRLDELTGKGCVHGEGIVGATRFLRADAAAVRRIVSLVQNHRVDPAHTGRSLSGGGWMTPLSSDEAFVLLQAVAGEDVRNSAAVVDFLAMWVHHGKALDGDLGEFAWRCLELAPKIGRRDAHDFDMVAGALSPTNPGRAFALLAALVRQPYDAQTWNPLDFHGRSSFLNALRAIDRRRVLTLLIEASKESPLQKHQISWHVSEFLDQSADSDVLIEIARASEANAETVLGWIRPSREGFWPIVFAIFEAYPESDTLRHGIASAVYERGHVIVGPVSDHTRARAAAILDVLQERNTPDTIKPLLERFAVALQEQAERERQDELDREVNM